MSNICPFVLNYQLQTVEPTEMDKIKDHSDHPCLRTKNILDTNDNLPVGLSAYCYNYT